MLPLALMLAAVAASDDHLRPEGVAVPAHERLAARTFGADAGLQLEMRESPSFEGERVVSIVKRDGAYRVVAQKVSENMWYAMVREAQRAAAPGLPPDVEAAERIVVPETEACSGPIARRTFEKIRAVWIVAIAQARPDETPSMGLDGTSYRFTVFDGRGARSGSAWSPEPGTNVSELVSLGEALIAYACGDASGRRSPERDLAKAADELFVRFRLAP